MQKVETYYLVKFCSGCFRVLDDDAKVCECGGEPALDFVSEGTYNKIIGCVELQKEKVKLEEYAKRLDELMKQASEVADELSGFRKRVKPFKETEPTENRKESIIHKAMRFLRREG